MKCPACGKDSNVTIGNRVYCTSCGSVVQDNTPPAAAPAAAPDELPAATLAITPAGSNGVRLTDIKKGTSAPLARPPAATVAPRPVVTPIAATKVLRDVIVPAATQRPAAEYHAQPAATPAAAPAAVVPTAEPLAPITNHTSVPLPSATPPPPPPASAAEKKAVDRLATAVTIPKSEQVSKFPITPALVSVTGSITPATTPLDTSVPVTNAVAPTTPATELPPATATQHEALVSLVAPAGAATEAAGRDQAFNMAMKTVTAAPPAKPNLAAIAGATLAIVVMGGYIWLQNYPRMQLSVISGKTGFTATLPGYVPPSYNLHGNVAYSAGQVTLHYAAAGLPGFNISQHVTSWDAASLLDNFVTKQAANYTAVEGQGLTIYLFGKGEAAWVNHGLWYSITGDTELSRSQILNIAYSL